MSTGDPRQSRNFKVRVWLARLVVTAERVWPALWPPLAILGIFAIVSLFGLWLVLPRVAHQPLRALDDRLPVDFRDPATKRLWLMHRQRLIDSLDRLRLLPPRSDLPRRDPWALRAALLLVLVVAVVHARGEIGPRLGSAFNFAGRPAQASLPPMVDLWITPPTYT